MGKPTERVELGRPLPNGSYQSPQAEPDSALGGGTGVLFIMQQAEGLPLHLWQMTDEICKSLAERGRFKCL